MKTNRWSEIENKLRREVNGPEPSSELHNWIMRAVNHDSAARGMQEPVEARSWWPGWILAGGAVAALVVAVVGVTSKPHSRVSSSPNLEDFEAPINYTALAIRRIGDSAMAPMNDEVANLRADVSSVAGFLVSCMPAVPAPLKTSADGDGLGAQTGGRE